MRYLLLSLLLLPLPALAWDYNDAPLLVVQQKKPPQQLAQTQPQAPAPAAAPAMMPNFPDWAVTQAGQNTSGNVNPMPGQAPGATAPNAPASPANAASATAPTPPVSPSSPTDKLWPRDTVPIFMKSCVGFHVELAPGCSCTITNLMGAMGHDEFLKLSADGSIERDVRVQQIRSKCIAAPKRAE